MSGLPEPQGSATTTPTSSSTTTPTPAADGGVSASKVSPDAAGGAASNKGEPSTAVRSDKSSSEGPPPPLPLPDASSAGGSSNNSNNNNTNKNNSSGVDAETPISRRHSTTAAKDTTNVFSKTIQHALTFEDIQCWVRALCGHGRGRRGSVFDGMEMLAGWLAVSCEHTLRSCMPARKRGVPSCW